MIVRADTVDLIMHDQAFCQHKQLAGGGLRKAGLLTITGQLLLHRQSIALMQQSRTLHAPAGATPLLVLHTQPSLEFLLTPVLSGSVLIMLVACLFHRVRQPGSYPKYWY
jgi:hypothetical protein